ncbi:hypothetical protein EDB83DRAFT_2314494 [Lactarius deliciosus]|nr:hypothetical protein EDB83DRAFT_2314494 [Lactarius deliciosus]
MAGRQWQRLGVVVTWRVVGCCVPCWGGVGVGRGWGLACCIEAAWQSLACRVEAVWGVGRVLCDVAGSWRVLGWGGRWRGGWWRLGLVCCVEAAWWGLVRCVEAMWWGLGMCWVRVAWGGRMEGVRVLQGLVHRVGAARWVGSGRVSGQDGGGSCALMVCNVQGFACRVGGVGWWWRRVASHVGAACWGGDEWKRLACMRGQQWPAMLKVSGKKKKKKKKKRTYLVHWAEGQLVLSHVLYLA